MFIVSTFLKFQLILLSALFMSLSITNLIESCQQFLMNTPLGVHNLLFKKASLPSVTLSQVLLTVLELCLKRLYSRRLMYESILHEEYSNMVVFANSSVDNYF